MWPFFFCLAAKTFVQPLTSYLITTAGTALSSGINECSPAPLIFSGYGCRDPFPHSLLSGWHPSVSSPPLAPFSYHFRHMLHMLAFTVHLHPPSPSSVIQFGKVGSHLQLAPGASLLSPTSSIFKQVILVFIPCAFQLLQGYLIILPQNTS